MYFLFDNCPKIVIRDSEGEQFALNDYFDRVIRDSLHQDQFDIDDCEFTLYHIKMPEGATAHELHLCANKREVRSYVLSKHIPNLQNRIIDENGNGFYYSGFLSGAYLDSAVNSSRTNFYFENDGQIDFDQSLPEKNLLESANAYIVGYLHDYMDEIIKQKQKRVDNFISYKQPKYRYLVAQRPSSINAIAPHISDKDLDVALYKELLQWDLEIKQTGEKLQEDLSKALLSASEVKERYDQYYKQINGLSKTSLAEYIIRRKVILDLLENSLQINTEGKYASEDSIHSIVCPMRYTSNEISFEEMNLWIIDERLAYHNFLASDKQMKSIPVIDSESDNRIDIAVFNEAISFSDKDGQFNSITMTDSLIQDAKFAGLRITPDGEGYFGYNPDPGAYIEVISFNKLIRDAKERNQVLFDKLFTPSARTVLSQNPDPQS